MPIKDPEARKIYNKQYFQSKKNNKSLVKFSSVKTVGEGMTMTLKEYKDPRPLKRSVEPIVYDFDELKDDFDDEEEEPITLFKHTDFVKRLLPKEEQDDYMFFVNENNKLCFNDVQLLMIDEFNDILKSNYYDMQDTLDELGKNLILYIEKYDPNYDTIFKKIFIKNTK